MKNTYHSRFRSGRGNHALRQGFRSLLLAIQAGLCLHATGFACDVDTLSLSKIPLEIRVLASGPGQVRIQFLAGEASDPVKNLLGFDLHLGLDANIQPGAAAAFQPDMAWTTADDLFTASISLDAQAGSLALSFRRSACQPVSGFGLLAEVLVSGLPPISDPDDLVRLTAGLVLEEVVNGARLAAAQGTGITDMGLEEGLRPSPGGQIDAWPQPTAGLVHWACPFDDPEELSLSDLRGQVLRREKCGNGFPAALDMGDLPAGIYFLRLRRRNGSELCRRIIKS